jgi:hypothetical protein
MKFSKILATTFGVVALGACGSGGSEANNMADGNMMATDTGPMDANMTATDMNADLGTDMNAGMGVNMDAGTGAGGAATTGNLMDNGTTGAGTTGTSNTSASTGGTDNSAGGRNTPSNTL